MEGAELSFCVASHPEVKDIFEETGDVLNYTKTLPGGLTSDRIWQSRRYFQKSGFRQFETQLDLGHGPKNFTCLDDRATPKTEQQESQPSTPNMEIKVKIEIKKDSGPRVDVETSPSSEETEQVK